VSKIDNQVLEFIAHVKNNFNEEYLSVYNKCLKYSVPSYVSPNNLETKYSSVKQHGS